MFGNKKPQKPKREHKGRDLSQYGLFDVSTNFSMDGGPKNVDDDEDEDLEAELAAISGGASAKPKRSPRKQVPDVNLDAMVAESLRDIASDEELSGADDDPDLLSELTEIAGEASDEAPPVNLQPLQDGGSSSIKLLNERLKMYEEAEKNAKEAGETSRARRFNRGFKALKDLIKQAQAGHPISSEEIPPEVSFGPKKPKTDEDTAPKLNLSPMPEPEPTPPISPPMEEKSPEIDTALVKMLNERKLEFKMAALKAKKAGDNQTALNHMKTAKQFDSVIEAAEKGQPVDLSRMPAAPQDAPKEKIEENETQTNSEPAPEPIPEEENLITASSVAEALQQRLEVYKKQQEAAKEAANSSKVRRMGRIVKQFEDAIKAHNAGKPIPLDELPTPPGYAPFPGVATPAPKTAPAAEPKPSPPKNTPSTSQSTRITGNQQPNSRAEKQLQLLLAKQKQFKEAALKAKREGEIDVAKEFLRTAKGFEPLIDAASCGLPVDLSTLPLSPTAKSQLENEYDVVMAEECTEETNTNTDLLTRLETQLTKQLKMCLTTRDHHKALGDVPGTNRFERLALNVTKDLDVIRLAHRTPGAGMPKFHYEMKDFSIVKCFTELNENDLELTILRGISYACSNPQEIDTYVIVEFPYPQEEPFSQRTATIKDTNNPEYNATYTIPIQRATRACQRVFKRHSVKFEVYSRGSWCASNLSCCFSGFFRSDTLLGTATVKLQPLETQCEMHESFDLVSGRKKVGGKLEVRMRLRHPIVSQQVEQIQEKWLIVDS